MGKKGELIDSEHVMVVRVRLAILKISETADLLGFFPKQPSVGSDKKSTSEWQFFWVKIENI